MHFGIYLVDNGVISCEEFYEALKYQLRTRPQLGALAIERRKLTVRQVFAVLREQCDAPADMFGELAVRAGYLSPEELAAIVNDQSQRSKSFDEVLIELAILSSNDVANCRDEYRQALQQHDSVLVEC